MPDEAWQEYLDPEFRDRAPRVERTDEGDFRVFEGRRTPIMTLNNLAGKKPEEFKLNVRKLEDQRSGAWDPAERMKDMDTRRRRRRGALRRRAAASADPELRLNSVRGYNRWLSDYASDAPGRLLGVAAIPIDTPELAVEEIRFAVAAARPRQRLHPAVPERGRLRRREVEPDVGGVPARRACRSVCTSVAAARARPTASIFESAPRFMTGLVMSKLTMAESVSELIHGLVMQRYPELKFVVGRGPDRLDLVLPVLLRPPLGEAPLLDQERAARSRRASTSDARSSATFMEDPVGLREREHIGIDNIMWASDYPHSETTWPNSKALTDEWFTPFGDEDKAKILWKNCAKLYGLV